MRDALDDSPGLDLLHRLAVPAGVVIGGLHLGGGKAGGGHGDGYDDDDDDDGHGDFFLGLSLALR